MQKEDIVGYNKVRVDGEDYFVPQYSQEMQSAKIEETTNALVCADCDTINTKTNADLAIEQLVRTETSTHIPHIETKQQSNAKNLNAILFTDMPCRCDLTPKAYIEDTTGYPCEDYLIIFVTIVCIVTGLGGMLALIASKFWGSVVFVIGAIAITVACICTGATKKSAAIYWTRESGLHKGDTVYLVNYLDCTVETGYLLDEKASTNGITFSETYFVLMANGQRITLKGKQFYKFENTAKAVCELYRTQVVNTFDKYLPNGYTDIEFKQWLYNTKIDNVYAPVVDVITVQQCDVTQVYQIAQTYAKYIEISKNKSEVNV